MSSETYYFISDLHLGDENPDLFPNREKHFHSFLQSIRGNCDKLFILGDLFDFWMEYRYYIPKIHFQTIHEIQLLKDSGAEIHYFSGNHDFNLGSFFSDTLGWKIYLKPTSFLLQGKKTLLLHGDGFLPSDRNYRILKLILLHPISNFLFRQLHPDWGMALARWVAKTSRKRGRMQKNKVLQYQRECKKILKKGYDLIVYGHIHTAQNEEDENGTVINLGEWYRDLQYMKMKNGICSIRKYKTDS